MRIAAQYRGRVELVVDSRDDAGQARCAGGHCDTLGRDFDEIAVSTQALIFMNEDDSALDGIRDKASPMPTMIGTPQRCGEILAEYHALGVDEFIVPDFTLPPPGSARDDSLAKIAASRRPYRG